MDKRKGRMSEGRLEACVCGGGLMRIEGSV